MKKPDLLQLRPTQFVLGMREVDAKVEALRGFGRKEMKKFCDSRPIPIVIGPGKELFLIDHHHFARACWEAKVDDYKITIVKNLEHASEPDFWNLMVGKGWVYLQDQFGLGPHLPTSLPLDIRFLADDPFRSLVWELIKAGQIEKDPKPFFEFEWAAFFRRNINLRLQSKSDFREATKRAQKLLKTDAVKYFPGYRK